MHEWIGPEGLVLEGPQHVTETLAFRVWFGKSKTVSRSGKPQRMYHATKADFDTFDVTEDIGFHFGSWITANNLINYRLEFDGSPDTAPEGANIRPVYLRAENPLRLADLGTWGSGDVAVALRAAGVVTTTQAAKLIEFADQAAVMGALAKKGYDSIVYKNETEGGGDSYIVFSPEQVRSAFGNGPSARWSRAQGGPWC